MSFTQTAWLVYLNATSFAGAILIKPALHRAALLPLVSLQLSSKVNRATTMLNHTSPSSLRFMLELTPNHVDVTRLPPPYATDCFDYPAQTHFATVEDCHQACLRQLTMRHVHKVPFPGIITEHLVLKYVSPLDVLNKTFSDMLACFDERCGRRCARADCYISSS